MIAVPSQVKKFAKALDRATLAAREHRIWDIAFAAAFAKVQDIPGLKKGRAGQLAGEAADAAVRSFRVQARKRGR